MKTFILANGLPAKALAEELSDDERIISATPCMSMDAARIEVEDDCIDALADDLGAIYAKSESAMELLLRGKNGQT